MSSKNNTEFELGFQEQVDAFNLANKTAIQLLGYFEKALVPYLGQKIANSEDYTYGLHMGFAIFIKSRLESFKTEYKIGSDVDISYSNYSRTILFRISTKSNKDYSYYNIVNFNVGIASISSDGILDKIYSVGSTKKHLFKCDWSKNTIRQEIFRIEDARTELDIASEKMHFFSYLLKDD